MILCEDRLILTVKNGAELVRSTAGKQTCKESKKFTNGFARLYTAFMMRTISVGSNRAKHLQRKRKTMKQSIQCFNL